MKIEDAKRAEICRAGGEEMTDMVEKVAKAIATKALGEVGRDYDPFAIQKCIPYARAAIAAMREPTDEMNDAGADKCDGGCAEESCQFGFMGKIWTAMIDAALKCSTKPDGQ